MKNVFTASGSPTQRFRFISLVTVALFSVTSLFGQTSTVTLEYTDAGFCAVCGDASYQCSSWAGWNPNKTFTDPTPVNSTINQIKLTYYGDCSSSFNIRFNNLTMVSSTNSTGNCQCSCATQVYTTTNPTILNAYNHGGTNTVTTNVTSGVFCINRIVVEISYTPCNFASTPSLSWNPNPVCAGSASNLQISGSLNAATQWQVYRGSCGGPLVGATSGSSVSISQPFSSQYFVRGVGGCADPSSVTISCASISAPTIDNVAPTPHCQNTSVVLNSSGNATVSASSINNGSTDNCSISTYSLSKTSFNCTNIGNNTVTLTVTDNNGNSASCNATVTVSDNSPPTIGCPSNITTNNTGGACSKNVSYSLPSHSDNCSSTLTRTAGPASGGTFPVGTTTVTYKATDPSGNNVSCSFTVTVVDNQNPTISCPSNVSVNTNAGCTAGGVALGTPTVSDNCSGVTYSNNATSSYSLGANTVTWTATDAAGNTASCNQTVTVNDIQNPTISCPATVSVNTNSGSCVATGVSLGAPTTSDNCSVAGTSNNAPSSFALGSNTVTWTVTDGSGNTASCTQTVNVSDNQNPSIACPSNVSVNADNGSCVATSVSLGSPTASDNCTVAGTSNNAPSSYSLGANTVTWTVTDGSGNTNSCNQTVTVVDTQNPTIACPGTVNVSTSTGVCTASGVSLGSPTTSDNCSVSGTSNNAPGTFPLGSTTVVWTVTDGSSNTATCNQTVIVTDGQNPTISCPSTVTVNADAGQCTASGVSLGTPTASDNCAVASTTNDGLSAYPVGSTTVTWTATDNAGNTNTCTQTVTVIDNQNPTISCPSNINMVASSGQCGRVVTFTAPTTTDNCTGQTLSQTAGLASGSFFAVGTQTLTFVVTDASSNTATCSFTVTITDNQPPVFLNCPVDFTVDSDPGSCDAVVTYVNLLANDNCDGPVTPVIGPGLASGATFPIGDTQVTYTATDGASNVGTCSFIVTVEDNEAPQMNCPSDQTVTFNASCQYQLLNYTGQVGFLQDNCDPSPVVTQSPAANTLITGSTVITMTATDADGNAASCTFSILPNDIVDPTIICPSNQPITVNSICQFTLPDYTGTAATDDCDPSPTVTQTPSIGSILTASTTVTLTATDDAGNTGTCTFNAYPADNTAPTISCPSNQPEVFGSGCQFVLPNYTGLSSTSDNCDNSVLVTQAPSPGTAISGAQTITLTAVDDNSNSSQCTFSVLPVDNTDPTVTCPSDQNVSFNAQCQYTIGSYVALGSASDDCDASPVISQSPVSGTSVGGTTAVTLTATDASGNTGTCTFNVIPSDNTGPTVTCPTDQTVSFSTSCQYTLLSYTGLTTVNDNCDGSSTISQNPAASTVVTGTTVITMTATDADNNTSTCTFSVIPNDVTNPTISCPSNQNVSFDASCQHSLADWTSSATAADNCDSSPTVTQSPASGTTISGQTAITLTVTDASGNINTCTFDVIPDDHVDPTISCPSNIDVNFNADCEYPLQTYTGLATAADNCDASPAVTQSPATGTVVTATQTITLTATDDAGNTTTCTFDVIPADHTLPTITCPSNQTEQFGAGCTLSLPDYTSLGTAADNCDASVAITQSPTAGTSISGGQTVTLTATDDAGNTRTCTFNVIPVDNTNPTISCPSDQTVSFNGQCQYSLLNYTSMATAADNCTTTPVVSQSPIAGTSIGTTATITLTATDDAGNTANCTFDVIPSDNTAPTVSCPGDQAVSFTASCNYTLLTYTGMVNVSDNCDSSPTVTQSPAASTPITATQTITITAEDADGNSNTCSFDVIPSDNTNPTISCPSNQNVNFDTNCQFTLVDYTGSATTGDNCDSSPTVTQSPSTGTMIAGQTAITLTVSDASGNSSTCTFNVIPDDNVNPTIVCPSDQIVSSNASCDFLIVDYTGSGSVSDNCDVSPNVTQSPAFGTLITVATNVTLTAEDANGNTSNCTFLVTPNDNNNPSISCPGDQLEDFDTNCEFTVVDYTSLGTATDNCSASPTVTQDVSVGTVINGTTTITLTATDGDSNTATCSFDVVPDDNTAPTVTCPSAQTESFNNNCQFTLVDYTSIGSSSDNCDSGLPISQSPVAGTLIGSSTVITLSSTDLSGNIGSCTFTVTPEDNTPPSLNCPLDQTVSVDANCEFTMVDYSALVSVSDNCDLGPFTLTQSPVSGGTITGPTTVTFSATDVSSNTGTCTFQVIPDDDQDPSLTCPANATVDFDTNCEFSLADYTASATVSDNCDASPALVQSPAAATTLTATTTVSITATDASGNSSTCTLVVTPQDVTQPSLTCPTTQNVSFTADCGFALVDYTGSATYADNCDANPLATQSPSVGTIVSGTTSVTITVTDDDGNTNTCSFSVVPDDATDPTIACPGNLTVNFDASCGYTLGDYTGSATAADNCTTNPTVTQSPASGTNISAQTTVTLTATDDNSNTANCTFEVIPEDNTAPTVTCPSNQTASFGAQCQLSMPSYTGLASATDNCDGSPVITQSPVTGSAVAGATVVTISATDASGNIGTCTFTVTPSDNTAPVLSCPADQVESFDANCQFTLPSYSTLVSVTDNCDAPPFSPTQSPAAGVVISGATTITYTFTDASSNTGTCTFQVLPNDDVDPTITCPSDQTVSFDTNCEFTLADYTGATVSDNCDASPTVTQSPAIGATRSSSTLVTLTVTDDAGNTATCSFNVVPEDATAPTIVCPANATVNFTSDCQFTIPDYMGSASIADNCDLTPYVTQSPSIGTIVTAATSVTINVMDDSGNTNSCSFTVTPEDNTVPTIICPPNQVEDLSANCDFTVPDYTAMANAHDNCDANLQFVQSPAIGATISSNATVTLTVIDDNGNSATCNFSVTLEDNIDPVISCPSDMTVDLNATCQFILLDYTGDATTSDNCDPSVAVSQSPNAGSVIGSANTITLTGTDDAGNTGTCTFTVTPEDNTVPTIFDCPSDIVQGTDQGTCGALITYATVTSIDNCAGVIVPTLTSGQASGTIFSTGTLTVIYTADDGNGNTTTCEFDVTVNDTEDPVVTCPSNITANVAANTCGADVTYTTPTATDNCTSPVTPILDAGLASGSNFPVGTTTVTYSGDDGNGNTGSCSFDVTVTDNEAPVITCPNNITTDNDAGSCDAVVTYSAPTVTDNCTGSITPTLSSGLASGSSFPLGTSTVVYAAVDGSGNSSTCSFTVTVNDTEDPVLTCPSDITTFVAHSTCQATVTYGTPTVADNCGSGLVAVLQSGPASGGSFPLGTTTVEYSANDGHGNTGTCSFTVTVTDNEAPLVTCPSDQLENFDAVCQLQIPDYTGLLVTTDNCNGTPTVSQSPAAGTTISGVTTVTLTATDGAGNDASCTFDVIDATPPVVVCPANQVVGSDINCQFTLPDYTLQSNVTDNCGGATLSQSPAIGTIINTQTTVTVTAEDDYGNTSTCDFSITLEDNIAPSITCLGNQAVEFDASCFFELPDYTTQAGSSDNCDGSPTITQDPAVGTLISGSVTVTLTSEDDNGNATSCTFTVIPSDHTPPTIVCPADQTVDFDANCAFALADYTGDGTPSDNCSTTFTVTQVPAAGVTFTSNTVVTLTAEDQTGNTGSCVFLVMPEDNIAPDVACPADMDVDFDQNCEYLLTDMRSLVTSSDNCSSVLTTVQSPTAPAAISSSTQITMTVTDGASNSTSCTFMVDPADNTAPDLTCAPDQSVYFNSNCQFEIQDYAGFATATDNCSGTIIIQQSPAAGTLVTGTSQVTLSGDDGNGNIGTCSFNIIPADTISPVITCPGDMQVTLSASCSFELADYTGLATVTDNCATQITVTQALGGQSGGQGGQPGDLITQTETIYLSASDGNGNGSNCSFQIIPSDVTPPTVSCPADQEVMVDANCQFELLDYSSMVVVTDNCGAVAGSQTPTAGTLISASTTVTISVEDAFANSASCTFNVNPIDDVDPTITCPSNQTVDLDANCQFMLPDYTSMATAADNCGSTVSVSQFPPASTFVLTSTAVTLTADDGNGNTATCSFAVLPQDVTDPVITVCPSNQTVTLNANCQATLASYVGDVEATDNCDASLQVSQVPASGTSLTVGGVQTVTITVVDDAGNSVTCDFEITLEDNTNPTVTCPADQVLNLDANCDFTIPDYTAMATATDACGTVTLTQLPQAGSTITSASNTTITATDNDGNTATCTFFVDVVGMSVSVSGTDASCASGNDGTATVTATGGTGPYTSDWGGFDPNALAAGSYSVLVSDVNGCTATGSVVISEGAPFEIQIDPSGYIEVCPGNGVVLSAGTGYAQYNWSTGATVSSITVSTPATYWLSVVNADGCVSNTDTVYLSHYDTQTPTVTAGSDGVLYCSNDSAVSYQWYLNGAPIAGATESSYCPTQSGNYVAHLVDANGCELNSFTSEYTFSDDSPCATGIEEYGLTMDVFPNPSTGMFTINYSLDHQSKVELEVRDLMGRQVVEMMQLPGLSGRHVLNLSAEADGVYMLRIVLDGERSIQQRLVLVK